MNITVTAPLTTSTMNIISRKLRTIHSTLNVVVHGDTPPGRVKIGGGVVGVGPPLENR